MPCPIECGKRYRMTESSVYGVLETDVYVEYVGEVRPQEYVFMYTEKESGRCRLGRYNERFPFGITKMIPISAAA